MHTVIRRYEGAGDSAEVARRAVEEFGPMLRDRPGFQGYYVVDKDHRPPLELELELRVVDDRLGTAGRAPVPDVDVVAVEGDVELAERTVRPV